ncbi:hypothetical protein ABIA30_003992 [Mycobacterium sp. MAA66]|uniref:hypothetical protein n=1 Tax=Mycobacterium sp. MAA66 TaxID=3156297 RepID=UPI0035143705
MVKNARAKREARRYQAEHPGISYAQALRLSLEEHERTQSTDEIVPQVDDTATTADRLLASHYMTNPFGLKPDNIDDDGPS